MDNHPDHPGWQSLAELVQQAQQGDRDAIPPLKPLLDAAPELWRQASDVAGQVESTWIGLLAGDDQFAAECLRRRVEMMQAELGGVAATPLERLLIQRITATWLQLQHAELLAASADGAANAHIRWLENRQRAAQSRHISAIRALSTLRRLAPQSTEASSHSRVAPNG